MLCTSIHAYRSLKLGIVKAGDDAILSKSGKFLQNISSACEMARDLPAIGGICGFIGAVASLYTNVKKAPIAEKGCC